MLTHEQFVANVARVAHQGTDRHAHVIYGLIRWLKPFQVVEVGAWYGYSSAWIARALQENNEEGAGEMRPDDARARLLVIDDYSLWPEQLPQVQFWHAMGLCDVGEVVSVEAKDSKVAEWPERVDFAYIDGDHSFEGCKFDAEKAIALGATCIVLHDTTTWWGPRQYVEECIPDGWTMIECDFDQGLTVMMKKLVKPNEYWATKENYPGGHI